MEGNTRTKINFKIPMKTNQKTNENIGSTHVIETFVSPLISDFDQLSEKHNVEEKQLLQNGISKNILLTEKKDSTTNPLKRKLNSEIPLYTGRNAIYPEDLNNLILPLFCKLCNAALGSAKNAHFHYTSKNHDKKINNWLADWSKRTGEPVPKIQKDEKKLDKDASILFCQYCNIKLTSLQDAKQHYAGKKHASKLKFGELYSGISPKNISIQSVDGRFGIGECFKPIEIISIQPESKNEAALLPESEGNTTIQPEPNKAGTYCEICKIHTTSEQQLAIHLQGTKHFKKLKEICPEKAFAERDSQLSKDILNCRTPSGQFYCKICNLTVPDDKFFSQHLISKRHAKNLKKPQVDS